MSKTITLVMAGGRGTRLWPMSTAKCPKQYIAFDENGSLLLQALNRNEFISEATEMYIVTTEDQLTEAKNHLRAGMTENNFIVEPSGRNTAPCIFLSIVELIAKGYRDTDVVSVVPSDQIILNQKGYEKTIKEATSLASKSESIVIVGVPPHKPHTGYGYIDFEENGNVRAFKEKPDEKTALQYLEKGHYLWNSGMFVATIGTFKNLFAKYRPDYMQFWDQLSSDKSVYEKLEAISFDYAVMEKSENTKVVKADFVWNDLGSWSAFDEVYPDQENIQLSRNKLFRKDCSGNVISTSHKEVAILGVSNVVIVEHDSKLLVMDKKRAQEVREIVDFFK